MTSWVHPSIFFLAGAILVPFLHGRVRSAVLLTVPLLALADVAIMREGMYGAYSFLGVQGVFGRIDKLSLLFGWVFTIMAFLGALYALHVREGGHHAASSLYVGASLGAVFAGDYLTLFIFWEIMAFSSVFLIWLRRQERSTRAGYRYLLMHVFGGILLLTGLSLRFVHVGSLAFEAIAPGGAGLAEWLILGGFALNAAVIPLHAWLPDAYPEATVAGAVFLCAFTTKTAVYVLARGFSGFPLLAVMGTAMTIYGVFYAVIENDMRRVLAYHIVSQVGYMVAGIGIGGEMAVNGACAHAFAHILYKALLFMGAGAVLMMAGTSKMSRLGGLWKTMPLTMFFYVIGAVSISGVPLFSGFVSKSMIVAAAHEGGHPVLMLLMNLAGVGTFLSVGLKVTWFAFFNREEPAVAAAEPPANMLWAMGLTAALCFIIGVWPHVLYRLLPFPVEYNPYTLHHLSESFQILTFTGLIFFLLVKKLAPEERINLDLDWFYRKGAGLFVVFDTRVLAPIDAFWGELWRTVGIGGLRLGGELSDAADRRGIDGTVDGLAGGVRNLSGLTRRLQSGKVQGYLAAAVILFFVLILLTVR